MWIFVLFPSALVHFERRRSLHILMGFCLLLWCELAISCHPTNIVLQILFGVVFFYLCLAKNSEQSGFKEFDQPLRIYITMAVFALGAAAAVYEELLVPLQYIMVLAVLINFCIESPGIVVYGILASFLPYCGEVFGLSSFKTSQINAFQIFAFLTFQLTIILDFSALAREKSFALEHQTELLTQASSIPTLPKNYEDFSDEELNDPSPEIPPIWQSPSKPGSDTLIRGSTFDRSTLNRFRERSGSSSDRPAMRMPTMHHDRRTPARLYESDPITPTASSSSLISPTNSSGNLLCPTNSSGNLLSDSLARVGPSTSWEVLVRDRGNLISQPVIKWICLASTNKIIVEHYQALSSGLGYEVLVAQSCDDIFQKNKEFSLILLDLRLDGAFSIPTTLAKGGISAPCVAVANEGTAEERELAIRHGMLDYLSSSSSKFLYDTLLRENQQIQDDALIKRQSSFSNLDRFKSNKELQKLQKIFDCFVPKQFQELIAPRGIERIKLGDTVCKSITILFSDIRDFTTMSEAMYINDLMEFLNAYLAFSLPSLEEHGGFVDKFIGDSVMCIFAQRNVCDQACSAIQASIQMLHSLDSMKHLGFRPSRTGIGINTGRTLIGILGTETRMEPTAIGDSVNLASRTESLCKKYGARLMITEHTYEKLGTKAQNYTIRFLDHVEVKGKKKACRVYEVIDAESEKEIQLKMAILADYEKAIQDFGQANFTNALLGFQKCLQTFPKELTCEIYVERCLELLLQTDFDKNKWDGVYQLQTK